MESVWPAISIFRSVWLLNDSATGVSAFCDEKVKFAERDWKLMVLKVTVG